MPVDQGNIAGGLCGRNARRWALAVLGLGLLLASAGCRPTAQSRQESFQTLGLSDSEAKHTAEQIRGRTVCLLWLGHGQYAHHIGRGCGVVLSEDGYLLTAAHCLPNKDKGIPLVGFANEGFDKDGFTLTAFPTYRVVWVGDAKDSLRDLAVLKVERTGLQAFEWAGDEEIMDGKPIVAAGSCVIGSDSLVTIAGGHVRHSSLGQTHTNDYAARMIWLEAPLGHGDSGGPVMLRNGRLLGITHGDATMTLKLGEDLQLPLFPRGASILRPSPQWIAHVIAEDRRKPPATGPTTQPLDMVTVTIPRSMLVGRGPTPARRPQLSHPHQ